MPDIGLSPVILTGIAAGVGSVTGFGGVLAGLYARGRTDGARDQEIADHRRRLDTQGQAISQLRAEGTDSAKVVARLEAKVDGLARTAEETREDVREVRRLVSPQGR